MQDQKSRGDDNFSNKSDRKNEVPAVRCRSIGAVSRVVGSLRHRVSDEGVKVDISVGVAVAVGGDSTALRSDYVQPAFRSGANAFEKRIIGEHRESSVNVRSIAIQHRSDVDRIVASPISHRAENIKVSGRHESHTDLIFPTNVINTVVTAGGQYCVEKRSDLREI